MKKQKIGILSVIGLTIAVGLTSIGWDISGGFPPNGTTLQYLRGDRSWQALSGIPAGQSTIVNDTATNATMYPTWVTATTGNLPLKVTSTQFGFNPSTSSLGLGAAPSTVLGIYLHNSLSGGSTQVGVASLPVCSAMGTTSNEAFRGYFTSAVGATAASGICFRAFPAVLGAAGAVTTMSGFSCDDQTIGTNNIGYASAMVAGANKWSFYGSGTAQNYFNGSTGLGISVPTAWLEIKAGTATAGTGPLKLNSGVNLTAPIAGMFEFTTDTLSFTKTTGPTRMTIPFNTDVHYIGTTSIALNRASGAQALTGITSIDGSAATCVGLAGTATALATPRAINGVNFDGSANIIAGVYARVSGSNATTTGQSLVDITGLTVALAINSTYEFEAVLSVASTEATNGCEYGVQYSVANGGVEAQIHGTLAATTAESNRINVLNTATPAFVKVAGDGGIIIKGIVTTGANAGNLTIQHLKVVSGTSTVYINSYLRVIKIG